MTNKAPFIDSRIKARCVYIPAKCITNRTDYALALPMDRPRVQSISLPPPPPPPWRRLAKLTPLDVNEIPKLKPYINPASAWRRCTAPKLKNNILRPRVAIRGPSFSVRPRFFYAPRGTTGDVMRAAVKDRSRDYLSIRKNAPPPFLN